MASERRNQEADLMKKVECLRDGLDQAVLCARDGRDGGGLWKVQRGATSLTRLSLRLSKIYNRHRGIQE